MKSLATEGFWRALERLPADVRRQAQRAYRKFQDDPSHPSPQFKKIDDTDNVWSVRIGLLSRVGIAGGRACYLDLDRVARRVRQARLNGLSATAALGLAS